MNLKIEYFDNKITFIDDFVNVVEIENKKYFYRFIKDLYLIQNGEISENIVLFDDAAKELNLNNCLKIYTDYFDFKLNDKKTQNEIIKYITKNISEEEKVTLQTQYKKIIKHYKRIINEIELPLYIDEEINIDLLTKLIKLGINLKNELIENLLILIDIEKVFQTKNILVFINLKQYITNEELIELYKYSIYNKVPILLIDSQCYGVTINYEKKLIIDENLDEFMI